MGKKIIGLLFIGSIFLSGCAPITAAEAAEQGLYTNPDDEDREETVIIPGTFPTLDSSLYGENILTSPIESPPCECHFEVLEENGLICLQMTCSESCPPRTRECASTIGGCTLSR